MYYLFIFFLNPLKISHFQKSHKKNYQNKRVGTFCKWNFLKSSKSDIPTFFSEDFFMKNGYESIMLCFANREKPIGCNHFSENS